MHAKYEVAIFNIAKIMSKVKVLRQTDKMTDRMTDRPKTIYPPPPFLKGPKNMHSGSVL